MKILDAEHLEVFHEDRGSPLLVVLFNEMTFRADGRRFWGQALCAKLGLSAVGIVSKRRNWFPAADMARVAGQVRGIVAGAGHAVGYGALLAALAQGPDEGPPE